MITQVNLYEEDIKHIIGDWIRKKTKENRILDIRIEQGDTLLIVVKTENINLSKEAMRLPHSSG